MQCEFKLGFNDFQCCLYVTSELYSIKTMCFWYKSLESVIRDFKDEGYNFNHIEEMNIITFVNKLDMSYDFYNKQNMHVDWKLNAMVNKNKNLINKQDRSKRHLLIKNISHVPTKNY